MTVASNQEENDFYVVSVGSFLSSLSSLQGLLEAGERYAKSRGIELRVLTTSRLAPDMFPFALQVKLACRFALEAVRILQSLEQQEIPIGEDASYEQLKGLVRGTIDEISKIDARAIEQARDTRIELPLEGPLILKVDALRFITRWSLPNFYFHVTTAHDLLRQAGVPIGKREFMSHVAPFIHDASREAAQTPEKV